MKSPAIDTNPHLKNEDDHKEDSLRSVEASSKIEGIVISEESKARIVKKVDERVKKYFQEVKS